MKIDVHIEFLNFSFHCNFQLKCLFSFVYYWYITEYSTGVQNLFKQHIEPWRKESCSPITLEYAEELLLMAYDGRCGVMDVSQIAKECPSGMKQCEYVNIRC